MYIYNRICILCIHVCPYKYIHIYIYAYIQTYNSPPAEQPDITISEALSMPIVYTYIYICEYISTCAYRYAHHICIYISTYTYIQNSIYLITYIPLAIKSRIVESRLFFPRKCNVLCMYKLKRILLK
jgi:hypothetical protein